MRTYCGPGILCIYFIFRTALRSMQYYYHLQMRNLRCREVKELIQGHTAHKQLQISLDCLTPNFVFLRKISTNKVWFCILCLSVSPDSTMSNSHSRVHSVEGYFNVRVQRLLSRMRFVQLASLVWTAPSPEVPLLVTLLFIALTELSISVSVFAFSGHIM